MSYILDALQRREAEHNPEAAAALVLKQHKASRIRTVGVLIAGALLVNAVVLVWLFLPTRGEPPATELTDAQAPPRSPPVATASSTPEDAPPALSAPPPARTQAVAARPPPPRRVLLDRLPSPARSRFPGLLFSTHVYADDPSLRAVVANGARLVEGDAIDGVVIAEITETGVLVAFEEYLVEIPVIAQWQ